MQCTYDVKFGMLQVRENEITTQLVSSYCAFAHLRGNTAPHRWCSHWMFSVVLRKLIFSAHLGFIVETFENISSLK